ncbi:FHA domain-containing protein [Aporhodopirellula aestuarii]|uniref:FHA domain-containing protein n=1 Tax=Aporhodopirellula aestuarii TaxID=2950107 RepID=A0ABT0UCG0_9BACT|nr:FHA domain-containing protein [Aporhodopirellula aestuarii]MCM2374063.1 FHA domain-containing protein [Aporhodopirellula aestuarii]
MSSSPLTAPVINQARLVLSTGSRAGLIAPIRPGFYLIGRDKNCQIRPKTRSVSRVHCLLYFGCETPVSLDAIDGELLSPDGPGSESTGRFHVVDLGSTSGTKINCERIPPRQWVEVVDGSELRCGKIAWQVVLEPKPRSASKADSQADSGPKKVVRATLSPASATPTSPEGSEKMLSGDAWQGADVAAFLAAHDEADREVRYEKIRASTKLQSDESGVLEDEESFDEDAPFLDSAASGLNLSTSDTLAEVPRGASSTVTDVPAAKILSPAEKKAEAARAKREQKRQKANQKRTALRVESAKRSAAMDGENPVIAKVKLVLAVALTVAVLGFGVYQVIQFRSGPPARVIDGID